MKSRFLSHIWLSLVLLFAQQIAFADALTHAHHSVSHHQCTFEEAACADSDVNGHSALDDFDNGLVSSFVQSVLSNMQVAQTQSLRSQFLSLVSPFYFSRAPPLL
jgi:hypothetical protein